MMREELEEFWSYRIVKIWVVRLSGNRRSNKDPENIIVRAKTSDSAIRVARANSIKYRSGRCFGSARYAHPVSDLNCTETTGEYVRPPIYDLTEAGIKHYYAHCAEQ